jgi:hypothetical protein
LVSAKCIGMKTWPGRIERVGRAMTSAAPRRDAIETHRSVAMPSRDTSSGWIST